MECPNCNVLRYKRDVKPSQWNAWSCLVNDFNCCKICNIDGFLPSSPHELRHAIYTVQTLRLIYDEIKHVGWCRQLKAFFMRWLDSDKGFRTYASDFGAPHRSRAADPHGACVSSCEADFIGSKPEVTFLYPEADYFDPGNDHYKLSFELLFGNVSWNAETVGDIIEAILGIQYLLKHYDVPALPNFPHGFATFLHDWRLAIYKLRAARGWIDMRPSDLAGVIFPLAVD